MLYNNFNNETNPYLRKQDELLKARCMWRESEWILDHLRTQGSVKPKTMSEEELLQWKQTLN